MSFYTEQLLTVCLGLTLALAFVVETRREYRRIDLAGAIAVATILAYIAYRSPIRSTSRRCCGPAGAGADLDLAREPARIRALVRFCQRRRVAAAVRLYLRALRALTYELAMLPVEGIVGSAILIFLVLEASRRTSGFGFVGIILAMAVYIYISPHLPGDFQTRWVSPERLVAYLGLDVNSMIGSILQVAVLVVIPSPFSARCWRAPAAPTSSPISRWPPWAASAAARPRSRWWARRCSA